MKESTFCLIHVPPSSLPQLYLPPVPFASSTRTRNSLSIMQIACSRRPPPLFQPFPATLSGLLLGASAAAAGILLGQLSKPHTAPRGPPCETCNGDGYIDCLCARWNYSSSDAPRATCQNCKGSLRTRCPRCRGGGTAVPTAIRLPIPVPVPGPLDDFLNRAMAFVATSTATRRHFSTVNPPIPRVAAVAFAQQPRRAKSSRLR